MNKTKGPYIKYNDRLFRITATILAAFFITAYGGDEDILLLLLSPAFYIEFSISFLFAVIIVEWVAFITRKLDLRYDWKDRTVQRLLLQLLMGVVIPAILEFFLAALYFRFSGYNILKTTFVAYAFPLIVMMIILLNVYYFVYYLILRYRHVEERIKDVSRETNNEAEGEGRESILVNKGALIFPVATPEIAYFFRNKQTESNFLRTKEGQDFYINSTLDEIMEQLDARSFFRANRQTIVSYDACKGFELLEYGKLGVHLDPPMSELVIVSQTKARIFKDWYDR